MWALVRRGKKMAGGALVYPEFFQEETTGGAYYGAQLLNTALQDVVQPAEQQWRFYYEAVVLPYTDIILGRGGYAGVDIVRQKFQTAAGSFMQKLARSLYGSAPQNTPLDIDNIDQWIGQTSNTIAGINRSTAGNSFWQPPGNQSGGAAPLSIANADAAYWQTVYGYDEPDLMVMDTPVTGTSSRRSRPPRASLITCRTRKLSSRGSATTSCSTTAWSWPTATAWRTWPTSSTRSTCSQCSTKPITS